MALDRYHFLDLGNLLHQDFFHALLERHDGTRAVDTGTLQLDADHSVVRNGDDLDIAAVSLENRTDLINHAVDILEHQFLHETHHRTSN